MSESRGILDVSETTAVNTRCLNISTVPCFEDDNRLVLYFVERPLIRTGSCLRLCLFMYTYVRFTPSWLCRGKRLTQIVSTKRRFVLEHRRTLDASATTAVNTRCLNVSTVP